MSDEYTIPKYLRLRILTPEEALFEGEVDWAQVPLLDGFLGVWPGHAPLAGAIGPGSVSYAIGGDIRQISIHSGILRVTPDECIVMVGAQASEERQSPENQESATTPTRNTEALFQELENQLTESLGESRVKKIQQGE